MGTGDVDGQAALPEDPLLASAAKALDDSGQWGYVIDAQWHVVFISDESRASFGWDPPLPTPWMGTAWVDEFLASPVGTNTMELLLQALRGIGGMMLADLSPAGVRAQVDPRVHDTLDQLDPIDETVLTASSPGAGIAGQRVGATTTVFRMRDGAGRPAGLVVTSRPAATATTLGWLAMHSDLGHLARSQRVAEPARRPAAVLFADLEGSSPLARRLSTSAYFALARRLVRSADHSVIEAGGLVGRHVGDGVAAFFLAEDAGSESAAARSCIAAARAMRAAIPDVAQRSGLQADDVVVRMGLHWGTTLFVGNITSRGRSEVTALGAEVNEAARIEACATGGRILASKDLIERLDPADAAAVAIDPDQTLYTSLADLPQATDKARRDAPAISVCEI